MKILLLENIHAVAKKTFQEMGFEAEILEKSYSGKDLQEKLSSADVVGIRSKTKLTAEVLKNASHLQAIGCFCIGTNQVDVDAARAMGIPVFNAPYSNTRSVAELVISEIIALSRRLFHVSHNAHQGRWLKSAAGANEVRGKTLGIIGYGHIGSQVSILAEALGLKVLFFDIIKKLPLGNSNSVSNLNDLLKNSDFVTLHVPATEETHRMMGSQQFQQMKTNSYFLNLSRGSVVDIPALAEALRSGHLSGAAVDVYPEEPKSNDEIFKSDLQGLDNVILTPHIGGSTQEAQFNIGCEVATSLSSFLGLGETSGAVGFPQLQSPKRPNTQRMINIHKNVPGVLGEINSLISKEGVNIQGQQLATTNDIGYLILDVEGGGMDSIHGQIAKLDTSLRTRILY